MKKVSRREFGKGLGVGVATLTLAAPNVANAISVSPYEKKDSFDIALATMLPAILSDRHLTYGKTVHFYKSKKRISNNESIEVNGMGSLVLQLCRGHFSYTEIVGYVSRIYNIHEQDAKHSVSRFLKFLFDKGIICFVSEKYLSQEEKRTGRGITVPNRYDTYVAVISINNRRTRLAF